MKKLAYADLWFKTGVFQIVANVKKSRCFFTPVP